MKTILKTIALSIALFATLAGSSVNAASLSSSTAIDLNLMTVADTDGSLATIIPDFGTAWSDANVTANGAHFQNDPAFASLNITETGGTVDTSSDPTLMLSQISVSNLGWGDSTGEYLLDYTALGTGQIEITIPYQLSIDAQTAVTTDPASSAWGILSVEDVTSGTIHTEDLNWFYGDGNGVSDNLGLLTLVLNVNDGDFGSLRFYTESGVDYFDATVVPLPAPAILMLSGLFGISIFGRKKAQIAL